MKKTIRDAIVEALKLRKQPLTIKEIFETIVGSALYDFKAKSPASLVSGEVRRHCEGINLKTSKPEKYFKLKDGKYILI